MQVSLKNDADLVRQVKVGWSWTTLFFGGIPFFFHGMFWRGLLWTAACILFPPFFLFLPFVANKWIARNYLDRGYKPVGEGWDLAGPKWGVSTTRVLGNRTNYSHQHQQTAPQIQAPAGNSAAG